MVSTLTILAHQATGPVTQASCPVICKTHRNYRMIVDFVSFGHLTRQEKKNNYSSVWKRLKFIYNHIYKQMNACEVIITFNIVITSVAKAINGIFFSFCWLHSLEINEEKMLLM